ncbi:WbqC family protein [Salmonirosea aquatica]|uniref:WbqC family protein n=1 Tax=Salmonirosea aquatica TaxID=2654236 RepID=A0A7C9BD49_9BACT|nr:hypothetical protein [Cytophagaceae bacterium SJW1-29]
MKSRVLLELHYLPCLEYFSCLMQFDEVVLDVYEPYVRQSYRNRCRVLTANKVDTLTVPVKNRGQGGTIREVRIDYDQPWHRRHWGCLQSAYGKSPYFEHYSPGLEALYYKKIPFLFDFNFELLTLCLHYLGVKKHMTYTLSPTSMISNIFDARSLINAKKKTDGTVFYTPFPYYQTFGNDFVSNLSIVDLLFNQGPESRLILQNSIPPTKYLNEQSPTDIG